MSDRWRLRVTEPCDGATNMAVDEAVWRGRCAIGWLIPRSFAHRG